MVGKIPEDNCPEHCREPPPKMLPQLLLAAEDEKPLPTGVPVHALHSDDEVGRQPFSNEVLQPAHSGGPGDWKLLLAPGRLKFGAGCCNPPQDAGKLEVLNGENDVAAGLLPMFGVLSLKSEGDG